jgi:hypothetical protein
MLDCEVTTVMLQASSASSNVDYFWFGPDGYFAPTAEASTDLPGDYLLMVSDQVNGCSVMLDMVVEQDLSECMFARRSQAAGGVEKKENSKADWNVYPNPARGNATVSFTAKENGNLTVKIYSAGLANEKAMISRMVNAGQSYQLPLDVSKMANGIYFCVMSLNGKQYTKKIVVVN